MIKGLLLVGFGGALGSMARWLCQRFVSHNYTHNFPWATLGVNIFGCFLIGILWGLSFRSFNANENWKLFLMTGLCGGFTTFSAFTLEGIGLMKEQRFFLFFMYVGASVLIGLLATWLGMRLSR
jgi:fluoride exporter